jgi:peroxiredoxin
MRKIIVSLVLMTFMISTFGQTKCRVTGICDKSIKVLFLANYANAGWSDSIIVHNGTFSFERKFKEKNTFVSLSSGRKSITFIADGAPITIDMSKRMFKGSSLNNKFSKYEQKRVALDDSLLTIHIAMRHIYRDKAKRAEYLNYVSRFQELDSARINLCNKAIHENQNNVIAAFYISLLANETPYEKLKEEVNPQKVYYNNPILNRAKQLIRSFEMKLPGTLFTDLEEKDTLGVSHKLSDYMGKGKYILVDFWASWCGPCMREMPNIKACYEKYHAKGFDIVGLSFDSDAGAWKNAIKKLCMSWINLSDLKGWKTQASSVYNINAIPSNILFDPDGRIVACDLLGSKLDEMLQKKCLK